MKAQLYYFFYLYEAKGQYLLVLIMYREIIYLQINAMKKLERIF